MFNFITKWKRRIKNHLLTNSSRVFFQNLEKSIDNYNNTLIQKFDHFSHLKASLDNLIISAMHTNGYAARIEISNILHNLASDPKRLENYGFKVYSQGDEDGIIEEICKRLAITQGKFCEIGVENGLECNSLYLIHKGWIGFWIEGNLHQKEKIDSKFKSILNSRLKVIYSFVTKENINSLFEQYHIANDIDFLSIDIDGNDIYILESINIRPKIICIEYNAKFSNNISKQQVYDPQYQWQGTDYFGASLKAITDVAKNKGYLLVATTITGNNAFFVREDLINDQFSCVGEYEKLYNPPRYWLIPDHFQQIGHPADFGEYVDLK